MFWNRRKKPVHRDYDREHFRPVIRSSICTGEEVAGFQNLDTGRFTEDRLLRSDEDLRQFLEEYGLAETPPTIY